MSRNDLDERERVLLAIAAAPEEMRCFTDQGEAAKLMRHGKVSELQRLVWILMAPEVAAQGRCIDLFNGFEDVQARRHSRKESAEFMQRNASDIERLSRQRIALLSVQDRQLRALAKSCGREG